MGLEITSSKRNVFATAKKADASELKEFVQPPPLDWWAASNLSSASAPSRSSTAFDLWREYFPQSTGLILWVRSETNPNRHTIQAPPSAPKMIGDILRYLGLTKMQLKDALGVSRQTLYDWLKGKFEPEESRSTRIRRLHEVALLVPQHSSHPVRTRHLSLPIDGNKSVLDLISQQTVDFPTLEAAVLALTKLSTEAHQQSAEAARIRHGYRSISENAQRIVLDGNLDEFDDQDDL